MTCQFKLLAICSIPVLVKVGYDTLAKRLAVSAYYHARVVAPNDVPK